MATRTSGSGDRGGHDGRRGLEPAPYLPHTAGLYSEVTWDRNWSTTPRRARTSGADSSPPPPPAE